jgi:hypothetical protein
LKSKLSQDQHDLNSLLARSARARVAKRWVSLLWLPSVAFVALIFGLAYVPNYLGTIRAIFWPTMVLGLCYVAYSAVILDRSDSIARKLRDQTATKEIITELCNMLDGYRDLEAERSLALMLPKMAVELTSIDLHARRRLYRCLTRAVGCDSELKREIMELLLRSPDEEAVPYLRRLANGVRFGGASRQVIELAAQCLNRLDARYVSADQLLVRAGSPPDDSESLPRVSLSCGVASDPRIPREPH